MFIELGRLTLFSTFRPWLFCFLVGCGVVVWLICISGIGCGSRLQLRSRQLSGRPLWRGGRRPEGRERGKEVTVPRRDQYRTGRWREGRNLTRLWGLEFSVVEHWLGFMGIRVENRSEFWDGESEMYASRIGTLH